MANIDVPRPGGGRANILDVATRAGVSPATVSRSLRGLPNVSHETRRRVAQAAHDLSYPAGVFETVGAEGAGRRSVAVIVPFVDRWFFGAVTAAAVTALHEQGYDAVLYHLGRADVRDRFFERMPLARRVAGILTLAMPLTEDHTLALRALDLPLVSVGPAIPGSRSVNIDDREAAAGAVNHLLHLGHRRIGFISGDAGDPGFAFASSAQRRLGWRQSLAAAGVAADDDLAVSASHGIRGGSAGMAQLLTRQRLPTALFAEYDELAIGAIWTIRRAGLAVPGDISVIGIDDHEMAAMLDLTTMAQDPIAQGQAAVQLLLQILEPSGDVAEPPPVFLPTRLLLRGTTAPPHLASDEPEMSQRAKKLISGRAPEPTPQDQDVHRITEGEEATATPRG